MLEDGSPRGAKEYIRKPPQSPARRTSPVLDAIRQALAVLSTLPESQETSELRDRCLAYEHIAEQWAREPPAPEEREALMKRVLTLHVLVCRVRQSR
jgi:hypothetical protein